MPSQQQSAPRASQAKPSGPGSGVRGALDELRKAIRAKDVESTCNSYEALRHTAAGMKLEEVLRLADSALGKPALAPIISAYSHRRCYMCDGGTAACSHCGGKGVVYEGKPCPFCEGIGSTACDFCAGTGWADMRTGPAELARAVLQRHLADTRKDLKRLTAVIADLGRDKLRALPQKQRDKIWAWMIRLQSRLTELARADTVDEKEKTRLNTLASTIESCLNLLH